MFALFSNKLMSGLNVLTSAVAHAIMPSDLDRRNRALVHARLIDQFLAQVNLMHPFLPTCSVYKKKSATQSSTLPPLAAILSQQGKVCFSHI